MRVSQTTLLALAGLSSAAVLPDNVHPEVGILSESFHSDAVNLSAYDSILEYSPAILARDDQDHYVNQIDNTCAFKYVDSKTERGWYCNAARKDGGPCCGPDSVCGHGPKFCGAGCQSEFGHCDETKGKPLPNPNPKPVPPTTSEDRCGPTNNNKKCPSDQCCSGEGYCGVGIDYCAVPQNCLRGFGKCDSDATPVGASTLKDPRPQLGNIEYGKYIKDCEIPGTVAMTFDDGPNVFTNELLDTLAVAGAKATFMVSGVNNGRGELDKGDQWPMLLKRMVAEGHQIASHTWSHQHMDKLTSEERKVELGKLERAIANVIGKYPTYMRPPYGECGTACLKDLKDMGYSPVAQTLDSLDWVNAPNDIQKSADLIKGYFQTLTSEGHALLCQHDIIGVSVQQLTPVILNEIKKKGFRAVTLGECLGDEAANWYRVPRL